MVNKAKSGSRIARTLLSAGFLLVITEKRAQAYTDPGSGALLVQTLFAGCVGCVFYLRRLVKWVKVRKAKE